MVTVLILTALKNKPMWSKELETWLSRVAGWELNERSLHRSLKRMADLGLITYKELGVPKTGANRKVYEVTKLGLGFLQQVKSVSFQYINHLSFNS